MSGDRRFYHNTRKLNVRSDVDGLIHTKQLHSIFNISLYFKTAKGNRDM